jgi:Folylpolyglutamate synthase
VLDGAHNPAACETLAETLADYDYDDLHLVYAAMHDKDHAGTAAALGTADTAITCRRRSTARRTRRCWRRHSGPLASAT